MIALLAAACGSDAPAAPEVEPLPPVPGPETPSTPDTAAPDTAAPEVPAERTTGGVDTQATSAPEWMANGTVGVPSVDGIITVAQVLTPLQPFDLEAVVLETLGIEGLDAPAEVDFRVTVHLAPDELPERFDAADLPVLGAATGAVQLRSLDWTSPGTFAHLAAAEPFAVPEHPVLIVIELTLPAELDDAALVVAGRRGAVGGAEACADHNPGARLLERAPVAGDAALPLHPGPDARAQTDPACAAEGPLAGFNMTLRLEGRRLTPAASEVLADELPPTPSVVALEDVEPRTDRTPAAPRERSGDAVRLRTLPAGFRNRSGEEGVAGFWWSVTGYPEIGQTVLVTEPFELTELRVGMQRVSALEGWRTADEDRISWDHDVIWNGNVPGVRFRITIWPVPDRGGATLDVAGIPALTEQYVTADAPIIGGVYGSDRWVQLRLATPVAIGAGHHLVSLGIDDIGPDPNAFSFYVLGSRHGYTDRGGFDQRGPVIQCDYPATPERYAQGRLYYRVFSAHGRPTPLANATTRFSEHRAKVLSESLNACSARGTADPMLPGDLDLLMLGR